MKCKHTQGSSLHDLRKEGVGGWHLFERGGHDLKDSLDSLQGAKFL